MFEIKKNTIEIAYKKRKEITEGCTLTQSDQEPEVIKSFESKEDALRELNKYQSEIQIHYGNAGKFYSVTEYYVEENEYDEDGEWIGGGDVWEFSKMPEIEE